MAGFTAKSPELVISEVPSPLTISGSATVAAVTGAESEPSELILKLVMVLASAV